jgi:competence protein ComEC
MKSSLDLRMAGAAAGIWAVCWWGLSADTVATALVAVISLAATSILLFPSLGNRIAGYLYRAGSKVISPIVLVWSLVKKPSPGYSATAITHPVDDQKRQSIRWWCATFFAAITAGAAICCWQLAIRDGSTARKVVQVGGYTTVDFVLTEDPQRIDDPAQSQIVPDRHTDTYALDGQLRAVTIHGRRHPCAGKIKIFAKGPVWRSFLPGQQLRVAAKLVIPRDKDLTTSIGFARNAPIRIGAPPWYQTIAGQVRTKLRQAASEISAPENALVPALSIGDTTMMSQELTAQFYASGLSHLSAVSGANLAIVLAAVIYCARWCRLPPVMVVALAGITLIGFVILARPSPSVLRAAVMAGIGLLALMLGRPRAILPALCVAICGLILYQPELSHAPGFALSVAATAGLVLMAPSWREKFIHYGMRRLPAEVLAMTLAAQCACTPLLVALGDGVNLLAIPANLLAGVTVPVITVLGVSAAVLAPLWMFGGKILVWLAYWPARWLVFITELGENFPLPRLPMPAGLLGALLAAVGIAVLIGLLRYRAGRFVTLTAILVAAVVSVPIWLTPSDAVKWRMVACDVGQGDALALRVGRTSAVIIDAGPEPEIVNRCMHRFQIRDIPLFIASHLHADHVGGVAGLVRGRRVHHVVSAVGQDSWLQQRLHHFATQNRATFSIVAPGWHIRVGELALRALDTQRANKAFIGTRSDPNNNSLVLYAKFPDLSVLLTGDVELEAQQALLANNEPLTADVLKVPHHGSAYSDPRFLPEVHAKIAVISVGEGNDYGHPSSLTISVLKNSGMKVMRTDRDGDCTIT